MITYIGHTNIFVKHINIAYLLKIDVALGSYELEISSLTWFKISEMEKKSFLMEIGEEPILI